LTRRAAGGIDPLDEVTNRLVTETDPRKTAMRTPFLLALAGAAALVAAPARAAVGDAEALPAHRADVSVLAGAWLPIGDARQTFEDAPLTGFQLAYELDPHLAVVGTFGWAPTRAKALGNADLDLYQYDLGLRGQHAFALGSATSLRPFLGVGVGARTYAFHASQYEGGTGFASYVTGGAELGWRAVAAAVTVRHQLSTADAPSLDVSTARFDLELFASVGLRF
jgi:hypothetical protein